MQTVKSRGYKATCIRSGFWVIRNKLGKVFYISRIGKCWKVHGSNYYYRPTLRDSIIDTILS